MKNERLNAFLQELSEITKKYSLKICDFGYCEGPEIVDMDCQDWHFSLVAEHLEYDHENQKYIAKEVRKQ